MNAEETKSLIPFKKSAKKIWFLSHVPTSRMVEVDLKFTNGKKYKYISRVDCEVGDIFVPDFGGATSHCIGHVNYVTEFKTVKVSRALKPLFVFSTDPDEKAIQRNVKAKKTLNPEKIFCEHKYNGCCIVDHYIANVLDSITVLAFPEFSNDRAITAAKKYLKTQCFVPSELFGEDIKNMLDYSIAAGIGNIVFSGYYPGWLENFKSLDFWNKDCIKKVISDTYEKNNCYKIEYEKSSKRAGDLFEKDPEFLEAFNELVYRSALSILIRGGFVNLLEAALTAEMPIDAYYDKLIDYADEIGSIYCCKVLKEARK